MILVKLFTTFVLYRRMIDVILAQVVYYFCDTHLGLGTFTLTEEH